MNRGEETLRFLKILFLTKHLQPHIFSLAQRRTIRGPLFGKETQNCSVSRHLITRSIVHLMKEMSRARRLTSKAEERTKECRMRAEEKGGEWQFEKKSSKGDMNTGLRGEMRRSQRELRVTSNQN